MKTKNRALLFLLLFLFAGCYHVKDKIEPKISCQIHEQHVKRLPSSFAPLNEEEKKSDWGKEYEIGLAFARELDLYHAVTSFKRAKILLGSLSPSRLNEIDYLIILSYYFGKKYEDATGYFEKSSLTKVSSSFSAYHDLLLILFESYFELKEEEKKENILQLLERDFPKEAGKIALCDSLLQGDLKKASANNKKAQDLNTTFLKKKKSVGKAQLMNAFLPGAGYLYVGQKRSAVTAFLLNSLFIFATYEFIHNGYLAAGIITASFEAGWYFGGIYGAGEEAKYYNERLYEKEAFTLMRKENLFPIFMIRKAF